MKKEAWKFRVRWLGFEPDEDSWLYWIAVKDTMYSQDFPAQIGFMIMQELIGKDRYPRKRIFSQVLQDFGYTLRKLGFVTKLYRKPLKGVII